MFCFGIEAEGGYVEIKAHLTWLLEQERCGSLLVGRIEKRKEGGKSI